MQHVIQFPRSALYQTRRPPSLYETIPHNLIAEPFVQISIPLNISGYLQPRFRSQQTKLCSEAPAPLDFPGRRAERRLIKELTSPREDRLSERLSRHINLSIRHNQYNQEQHGEVPRPCKQLAVV